MIPPAPRCKPGSYPIWRDTDGGYWACVDRRPGIPSLPDEDNEEELDEDE